MNLDIDWKPTKKQYDALSILEDNTTNELLFGGGAGGGKSYLGCAWLILNCLKYPGSRWLMGRAVLKSLKDSTLLTFFEICTKWKLSGCYNYNQIEGTIKFYNSSVIYLKDLFEYPSDPEFADLGSREFTGVFIDEGAQITLKAFNICKSRIRYKLEEFGLIPKILICSNPSKNFLYYDFYKPYKSGTLVSYRKFLQALAKDNQSISKYYIENLQKLDKVSKERLLYGNWEYDEDLTNLFNYDKIIEMFGKELPGSFGKYYISADIARFGNDVTTIILWKDFTVEKIFTYKKQSIKETRLILENLINVYKIPVYNVVIDEDGVGGGLIDEMHGVRGFINNARPLELKIEQSPQGIYSTPPKHNYLNLKSQCYFYFAKLVNNGLISIKPLIFKTKIIEDLEQIKQKDPDKDGKLNIVSKEDIKKTLGRSTDYGDALMMRMIFELKKPYTPHIAL